MYNTLLLFLRGKYEIYLHVHISTPTSRISGNSPLAQLLERVIRNLGSWSLCRYSNPTLFTIHTIIHNHILDVYTLRTYKALELVVYSKHSICIY